MARPAKSVRVKSGAIAKEEAAARLEDKLRGAAEKPSPPENMPEDQREVFQFIVDALVESDILGKLDVFVLESTAVAVARLRRINRMVDQDDSLLSDTALQGVRAKYQSDLWRGCSQDREPGGPGCKGVQGPAAGGHRG